MGDFEYRWTIQSEVMWVWRCFVNWYFHVLHLLHLKSLSPVCVFMWLFSAVLQLMIEQATPTCKSLWTQVTRFKTWNLHLANLVLLRCKLELKLLVEKYELLSLSSELLWPNKYDLVLNIDLYFWKTTILAHSFTPDMDRNARLREATLELFLNSSLLKFIAWLVLRAEVKVEWLVTKIFWIYLYWCFVSDVVRVDEKLTASRSKNLMFIHGKHEKDVQWCCEGRYKFGRRPSENSRCNNLMYMVGNHWLAWKR